MHPLASRTLFWPTFLWNAALGRWLNRRNWWDFIEPQLILGAMPWRSDIPQLASLGVTGVVNMCIEYAGPVDLYHQHNILQLHLPTVDFNPPSLADVEQGVAFIHQHQLQGGKTYIHCKAGRARSATVAICYLILHRNLSPQDSLRLLLEKRPHVMKSLLQRQVVQEFIAKHAPHHAKAS